MTDNDFVFDLSSILKTVFPRRPRVRRKRLDSSPSIPAWNSRSVELRREHKRAVRRFDPGVESIHQNHAAGRWCAGREQKRVITPSPNTARSAGSETAQTIALAPVLRLQIADGRLR